MTLNTAGKATLATGNYVASNTGAELTGQAHHFSWAGAVASASSVALPEALGVPTLQDQARGVAADSFLGGVVGGVASGASQREVSQWLGDNHVASWESIGENAVGSAVGSSALRALPHAAAKPRDVLGDYNKIGGQSSMRWTLQASAGLEDRPALAGRDWASDLAGTYGLAAMGDSAPPNSLQSWGAAAGTLPSSAIYNAGLDPAYASLNVDHPEAAWLPAVPVTANVPGIVSESYDPAWASSLASSHGASGFDEAAFRGTGDFAYEQGRLSRNTQAVSDRRAVAAQNYVMQRDAFRPVEATWASKLYDRAVAYGDARTETDRLFHPIEYQLGTRYWMAHALEGAGNVVASFEGLRNKSDGGLFDQGTNPFTQQSRWGVENQDTRLLAVANLATVAVSGLESVAAGAVRSGAETTVGVNGHEMVGSVDAWMASREVPATGTLRLPDLADDSLVRVYGGDSWAADVGQGASSLHRLEATVPGEQDVLRVGSDIVPSAGVEKPAFSGNWDNFRPQGVMDSPLMSPEGTRLVNELEPLSYNREDAIIKAEQLMASGSTLPYANPVEVGDTFYKLVPQGSGVGPTSPFWATESQIAPLRGLSPGEIANRLGLPLAQQQGAGFSLYSVRATSPGISFTSQIAPTEELGANGVIWTQRAGEQQTLLINRRGFSAPQLVDPNFH